MINHDLKCPACDGRGYSDLNKRRVLVTFSSEVILTMLKQDVMYHVSKGVPATTRILDGHFTPEKEVILILADESFPPISDSLPPPEFDIEWVRVEPAEEF